MIKIERRQLVYDKFKGHCAYCGDEIKYKDMQVDHIIPKQFFIYHIDGKVKVPKFLKHLKHWNVNHSDNLNPSCRKCNLLKDTFSLEKFRFVLSQQLKRANEYSTNYRFAKKYGQVIETPKPIVFYFETLK